MKLGELMDAIDEKSKMYFGLDNVPVVDKDGNEIKEIQFKLDENKIVIK